MLIVCTFSAGRAPFAPTDRRQTAGPASLLSSIPTRVGPTNRHPAGVPTVIRRTDQLWPPHPQGYLKAFGFERPCRVLGRLAARCRLGGKM